MEKIEVIVYARDGVVQAVQASCKKRDINVTVVDWDNYTDEYDEDGSARKELRKELAKIRKGKNMKYVW